MSIEERVRALGLELPPAPKPVATYATAVRHGDLLYVAGTGPVRADGTYLKGRLGADMDVADGRAAARLVALAMLATVRAHLGTLDAVERILKVLGFVNATPEFTQHPQVINGFSDLMVDVFGEAGRAARSALGVSSLPMGTSVEVEALFALRK
jgi:enamine deaminase RidA (YjgF/YER057c/UK114 family)